MFEKKCEVCKEKIEKGKEIKTNVPVYGRVDKPKRTFCSDHCLQQYLERTEQLMKTRRPNICSRCLR